MKELEELTEAEEVVLFMACQILDYSLIARVPKQRITKKVRNMPPKYLKKAFKSLVSNGFLRLHPSGRNPT